MVKLLQRCLLLAWIWLGGQPAAAQDTPASRPPLVPAALAAAPLGGTPLPLVDTAEALHRFFAGRRVTRALLVGGTCGAYLIALNVGPSRYGTYDGTAIRIVQYTPLFIAALVAEFVYYGRYSRRRERRVITDWRAHRLSPRFARHLKPALFLLRPPASSPVATPPAPQ